MSRKNEKTGPKFWRIILWDKGYIRPGAWQYNTEAEALEDMLTWNRRTGADGHYVYPLGVVAMYMGQTRIPRHRLIHAFEKLLAQMQRDRLDLAASLKKTKQWVPQEDEPNLD